MSGMPWMSNTHHPLEVAALSNLPLKSAAVFTDPWLPQMIELIW